MSVSKLPMTSTCSADVIADVIGQQVHLDVIVTISDVIVRALCQN